MNPVSDGTRSLIVIGETNLARHVCASLRQGRHSVQHLTEPRDEELRTAMTARPQGVAVLLHDDVAALRYALAIASISGSVPIIVTIFDRTVADELLRLLPQCDVTSPAGLVAPALAGPCVEASLAALRRGGRGPQAVRVTGQEPRTEPWHPERASLPSRLRRLAGQLRPHDAGTRIMLAGMAGMLTVLLADWAWLLGLGRPPAEALFDAARVVTTVGPATAPHHSALYQAVSSAAMLGTVVFSAMFTAGLVDRMLGPRLVGLIGPRTVPRFGHVIVVGIGQVGLRLCRELQLLGVPVVGVERDPSAPNVRLARSHGIPVVTGHGGDRAVLERLHLRRATALAAVGSGSWWRRPTTASRPGRSRHARAAVTWTSPSWSRRAPGSRNGRSGRCGAGVRRGRLLPRSGRRRGRRRGPRAGRSASGAPPSPRCGPPSAGRCPRGRPPRSPGPARR